MSSANVLNGMRPLSPTLPQGERETNGESKMRHLQPDSRFAVFCRMPSATFSLHEDASQISMMAEQTMLWRRLDVPGHDACALRRIASGWRLEGTALFALDVHP